MVNYHPCAYLYVSGKENIKEREDALLCFLFPLHDFSSLYFNGMSGAEALDGIFFYYLKMRGFIKFIRNSPQILGRGEPFVIKGN